MPAKKLKAECFKIVNKNGEPVLFRTDNVAINKLTFTITNLMKEPLSLTGGDPVRLVKGMPPATATGGGSTFNFDFESMLTAAVVKDLKLTLPAGWKSAFFESSESTPASWSIAPSANIVLAENEVIKVEIENISCSTTAPGNFEILYRNIPGYTDSPWALTKHLNIVNPPDDKKAKLPIDHGYINPVHPIQGQTVGDQEFSPHHAIHATGGEAVPVYITYDPAALIQNGFTVILTNTSRDPLVPGTGIFDIVESSGGEPPVVYLSFVFGEEDYAVTTQQLADNNITIDINAKLPWQPAAHAAGSAYWQFSPQSKQIMQGLETIYLPIKKIITQLNAQPPDAISILYIQINNIPGYNDAVYTLQLQKKEAKAKMDSLSVSKREITIGDDITVSWKSALAKRVTIDYKNRDNETIVLDSAKGDIKLDGTNFKLPVAPSAQHTVITATAYDNTTIASSLEKTVTVNQVPASIQSFSATPPLLDLAANADITISWSVTNAQKLLLTTPDGEIDVTKKTGHVYKGLKTAFRFKLKATSYYHLSPEVVNDVADVFTVRAEKPVPLTMRDEKIQPQPAILVNRQYGRVYVVNSSANQVCDIDAKTLLPAKTYPGNVIVLSQNNEKLFVFNPVPTRDVFGMTVYEVKTGEHSRNTNLYSEIAGPYPGKWMLPSPVSNKMYCSVDFHIGQYDYINVQIFDVDGHYMKHSGTATGAGDKIRTMAFNNRADKLYVAHDSYIEVKTLADLSGYKRINLPATSPRLFACNKTDSRLYLTCEDGKLIAVVDTNADTVTHGIVLKDKPVSLALSPDDKFLYAGIYNSNEIAVIDTHSNTVVSTITTGQAPYGIATDKEGDLLFNANYCAKTLSVFDLKKNRLLSSQLATGNDKGNPFDVGVYENDGTIKVFVAKEAYPQRITCSGDVKNTALDVSIFSFQKPKNR